ncbi:MAG: nucleotidyltransferase family protein [Hyphomicrobium sp.]|nr:nucleotidyltransferase family protein [Hyphomicrobium sp.]
MQSKDEIVSFLGQQAGIMRLLTAVAALEIKDCWIGAGTIRNAIWDQLHGFPARPIPGSDVDVVFHDPSDVSPARDLELQRRLLADMPGAAWEVHNQARMWSTNGDPPYGNTADAPPLHDVGLIVRPTPAFAARREEYCARQTTKKWRERWPKLRFITPC